MLVQMHAAQVVPLDYPRHQATSKAATAKRAAERSQVSRTTRFASPIWKQLSQPFSPRTLKSPSTLPHSFLPTWSDLSLGTCPLLFLICPFPILPAGLHLFLPTAAPSGVNGPQVPHNQSLSEFDLEDSVFSEHSLNALLDPLLGLSHSFDLDSTEQLN